MLQLELVVTENGKAQGNKHSLEVAVPISESLERDGEHYVVLISGPPTSNNLMDRLTC